MHACMCVLLDVCDLLKGDLFNTWRKGNSMVRTFTHPCVYVCVQNVYTCVCAAW